MSWAIFLMIMLLLGFLVYSLVIKNKESYDSFQERLETPEIDKIVEESKFYEGVDKEAYNDLCVNIEKFKTLIESATLAPEDDEEPFMLMDKYEESKRILQKAVDSLSSISSSFVSGDSDDIDIVTALANELQIEGNRVINAAKENNLKEKK